MPVRFKIKPSDKAAVEAAKASIPSDTTILGVTGTLAAAGVTLDHLGGIAGDSTVLAGCNIGTVTLTDCYGVAVASALDLSDNRMNVMAICDLVQAIFDAIVTGASGADLTLDISGNVAPNFDTIEDIRDLAIAGCTITVDAPVSLAVSGGTPDMTGTYLWHTNIDWRDNRVPGIVYWTIGDVWEVFKNNTGEIWHSASLYGIYTPAGGGAVGNVTVAAI